MPRGGARVGAGRPRKSDASRWLAGNAGKRAAERVPERPKAPVVRLVAAPDDLDELERAVWNRLAPHAAAAQTLVESTVEAFVMLCRAVVLERELSRKSDERGGPSHRGMIQRVEAGMLRFRLSPMGKPVEQPEEAPADPFAEFDPMDGVQ